MNFHTTQTPKPTGFYKAVTSKVKRVRYKHFFGIAKLHADSSLSIKNNRGMGIIRNWAKFGHSYLF